MADKVKLKNSCNKSADNNGTHDDQPAILTDTNNVVLQSRFNSGIIVGKNPKKKKETDAGEIDIAVGRVDNAESKVLKKILLREVLPQLGKHPTKTPILLLPAMQPWMQQEC
jgi:hypothetical protein